MNPLQQQYQNTLDGIAARRDDENQVMSDYIRYVENEENKITEESLSKEQGWITASKILHKENTGSEFEGTDEEAAKYGIEEMGRFNYKFFSPDLPWSDEDTKGLIAYLGDVDEFSDRGKLAFYLLMEGYAEKKQSLPGWGRALTGMASDPTSWGGITALVALAAKFSGRQVVGQGVRLALRNMAKSMMTKYAPRVGAAEGAAWGAVGSIGEQEVLAALTDSELDVKDWLNLETLMATGVGTVAGYSLVKGPPALYTAIKKARSDLKIGGFDLSQTDVDVPLGELGRPGSKTLNSETSTRAEDVRLLLERYPETRTIVRFMTDREVQVLNRAGLKDRYNTVLGLVEKYERQGLHKEIQSIALAGQAKRGWYKESGQLLEEMFAEDFPRFAALLGATSPKLSVKGNLTNALNIWKNWDAAGRPQDAESIKDILATSVQGTKGKQSVMEAWVPNTISALTEADENLLLSGGKVDSFMRNIMGDPDAVTLDTWMANYFGTKQSNFSGGKNPDWIGDPGFTADYMATSIIVRKGAKELSQRTGENWTPAEIQETVWSFTKTVVEMRRNGDPRSIMEIIKSGEITNDLVRGTDDFATLMGDEGITSIIEGTPYGRRLREATERSRATGGGEQGAASTSSSSGIEPAPRHLVRAGRRLERNYRDAAEPGIIRDIRKSLDLPFTSRLDGGQTSGTGRAGHRNTDEGTGTFTRTNRTYRTDKLGKLPYRAVYQLSAKHAGKLNNIGRSTPALVELDSSPAAGRLFREKITASKEASEFGAAVYLYEADEYAAMRLFVTRDGTSGFAIKPDGDIVSVFNVAGGKHTKVTPNLLLLAVEQGGRRLDCFDTQLPEIYSHSGFRAVSRTKWVDEFAPEDWDKTVFGNFNNGEPDVVYMVYDPSYTPTKEKLKYKKSHGKVVGDPDEAAQLQSIELESLGQMGEDDLRGIYSGYTGASQ